MSSNPENSDHFLIDPDQLEKLRSISGQLQGGTDQMRDIGHRLWLLVSDIESQKGSK